MKTIEIFDPPMCCASGVCGPDVDPVLPWFAGVLGQLASSGVKVVRFNLAQQPLEFVRDARVRQLLEAGGTAVLPAIFVDGELAHQGGYPEASQAEAWIAAASESAVS